MINWRLTFITAATVVLTACADLYGTQQPAPVFGSGQARPGRDVGSPAKSVVKETPPVIITKPLEGFNSKPKMVEIQPDFPPKTEAATLPPGLDGSGNEDTDPFANEPAQTDTGGGIATGPEPVIPEPPKPPEQLETLETFAPQSPAVGSLLMAANENSQSGNLDTAVANIERAIRIEPRNATLYYKLATLRLKQEKPRLAEDLARKAALLAVNDTHLKKHSWLLVAKTRELQGNSDGAEQAKTEAEKY